MTDVKHFPESEFPTIHCTKLIVHPISTDLKWNSSRKHPGIGILGQVDTAKSLVADGYRGILANKGYLIGTSKSNWQFIINESVEMYFGLAIFYQEMSSIDGVALKKKLYVNQHDRVKFSLTSASTVIISHEKLDGSIIQKFIKDVTAFNTQTLYPWVSTVPFDTMSVKILNDVSFITDVRPDGLVRMTASNNDIIDFNLNDITNNSNLPSGGGSSGDVILNSVSGSYVKVTDSGEIDMEGGVKYKCDNIISAVSTYTISKNQNIVMITNPTIIYVRLPIVADTDKCRSYTIIRNYNLQPGETWQDPALKIIPNPGDTIELDTWLGLPPHTNVELLSDSINDWRVV